MQTDTLDLPALDERMSAADLALHVTALRREMGGKAEVYLHTWDESEPVRLAVYPNGICSRDVEHFRGLMWPAAFAAAFEWARTQRVVIRERRIRQMALAIIDLTDTDGACTKHGLRRREFTDDEIRDLSAAACERASEMAGNAPFVVEGDLASHGGLLPEAA
jgi:hypothetical protein